MNFNHFRRRNPQLDRIEAQLGRIEQLINKEISIVSPQLQKLTDAVAAERTIDESAITLIQGLAAQITAAKDDPAALAALADSLTTESNSLAAAVSANVVPPPPSPMTGAQTPGAAQ
jgi:hypothetical protein